MLMRRVSRQLQGTTERVTIAQVMSGRIEKWRDFKAQSVLAHRG
jgi:hypothetical protein